MSSQLPDVLPALKTWLINLDTNMANRVAYRLPRNPNASPFGRLTRTGGGPQSDAEVPVVSLQASLEIWGIQNSDYDLIRQTALQVEQAVHDVNGVSLLGPGVVMLGANVLNGHDSPDPDTGWPRYIMLLTVTARAA